MIEVNEIPIMDDPMGKHWGQPKDIREAVMKEDFVLLTEAQIKQLKQYDRSLPSGVYPGKCWTRLQDDVLILVWYGAETPDHQCPILFKTIIRIEADG